MTLTITQGTMKDLINVLSKHRHFGHVVHPVVLSHQPHKCIVKEDNALFVTYQEGKPVYTAPVGPNAIEIIMKYCKHKKGARMVRLTQTQLDEVHKHATFTIKREYEVLANFLPGFDTTLRGKRYKTLRKDIHTAEKAGLTFSKATTKDKQAIRRLHKSWREFLKERAKTETDTSWIVHRLKNFDRFTIFKVKKGNRLLAAAGVGYAGSTAFMDFRISRKNKDRATSFLDYNILSLLKKRGIVYLERGRVGSQKLTDYKMKFQPLEIQKAYDIENVLVRKRIPSVPITSPVY